MIRRSEARERFQRGQLGGSRQAVWWQLLWVAATGLPARVRAGRRKAAEVAYGVYASALGELFAPAVWVLVVAIPGACRRWRIVRGAGHLAIVLLASAFAPAQGSLAAELVPTFVRATVAGWLTVTAVLGAVAGPSAFGVLAEATGDFAVPARLVGSLVALSALGFRAVPELEASNLKTSKETDRGVAPGLNRM